MWNMDIAKELYQNGKISNGKLYVELILNPLPQNSSKNALVK